MLDRNIEKLASGYRINRAADDAAGLAISERFRAQVRGLSQAEKNVVDGISVLQTAEGAMKEMEEMLQRMRQLAVQVANQTYTSQDREHVQTEINQILAEIDRLASTVQFNTIRLFLGHFSETKFTGTIAGEEWKGSFVLHIGANQNEIISLHIKTLTTQALGIKVLMSGAGDPDKTKDLLTREHAESAITILQNAIDEMSARRATLGAYQNRLEHIINAVKITHENTAAAESRIRDTDMAEVMSDFVRNQILAQAGTAMLAQANMKPRTVLQLLG
jgi:flagellin